MTDAQIVAVIRSLMVADHLGDVRRSIVDLCLGIGLPEPEGNALEGWTAQDWLNVGVASDE